MDIRTIFSEKGDKGLYLYKHPHEKSLLDAARAELAKCPSGAHRLKIADVQEMAIHVIKGPDMMSFVPNGYTIYITAPVALRKPDAEFLMDLTSAIREAEQLLLGLSLPDKAADEQAHATLYHSRQLDLIVHSFKIAEELTEINGNTNFLDKIENYGYGELYKTYRQGVSNEELVDLYISTCPGHVE